MKETIFFQLYLFVKMRKKILVNKYVPNYVPKSLPWYERDGLIMALWSYT